MGNSFISQENLNRIFEHAEKEHTLECCGIVTGPDMGVEGNIVYPCTNIQNRLHAENPKEHPRDARTAYYIDPDELLKILKKAREKKYSIKAFYHTHTENKAYFSEEDRKQALVWGEPIYPGARYIIVSIISGKVEEFKIYAWDEKAKDFRQEKYSHLDSSSRGR